MRVLTGLFAATLLFSTTMSQPNVAADSTGASVVDSVEVNAPPKAVYDALRKHRLVTPGRKVVSYKNGQAVINEQFENLPIIGKADVTYVEEEKPNEIEYKLIKSDKIKRFDGSWKIMPEEGGKRTMLQLITHTDTGMRVPFSATITKNNTKKRSQQRLAEIKRLAETSM